MEFNFLKTFIRVSCKEHPCKVSTNLAKWFRRRSCLKKLLTDARTDDGQWAITKAHLGLSLGILYLSILWTLSTGQLKIKCFIFSEVSDQGPFCYFNCTESHYHFLFAFVFRQMMMKGRISVFQKMKVIFQK
jgi:hypothetical protein